MSHTALVTGATGYIGQALCAHLRKNNWRVIGVGRQDKGVVCDAFISRDLTAQGIEPKELSGVDCIFHCAGKAHALSERTHDDYYFQINTHATDHLLKSAHQADVRAFVYFSSVKAMVEGSYEPMDETSTPRPLTPYGKSKLQAEELVLSSGLPHKVILRPTLVYGGAAKGNMDKMLSAIDRNRFPPIKELHNRRSMVCLHDVVQAAEKVAIDSRANGQRYILTDGKLYSTRQIYEMMCNALNKPVARWQMPLPILKIMAIIGDGIGRIRGKRFIIDTDALDKLTGSAAFSSRKITTELDFVPQWDLPRALPEMVTSIRTP